jgi:Ca2+-binding EF-hand superfamily protein
MKNAQVLILALLIVSSPMADAASHRKIVYIDQYDQDLDGRVSSVEFESARRARFDITDSNGDGSVEAEEYVFEWEDRLDAQLALDREEQVEQTAARHKSLDDDEDGVISREEFDASGAYSFGRYDSNEDNIIGADDVDSMAARIAANDHNMSREQILLNQKRMLNMPSTHSKAGTIEQYDTSGDETVTRAEFEAGRNEQFAAMDENSNGAISVDEYVAEFENRVDAALASFRKQSVEQAYVRFGALDKDENELMTFAEYQVSGHRTFTRWDTDADGYVTLEEAEPLAEEHAVAADTPAP